MPITRSQIALARGACGGVLITVICSAVNTASKTAVNFVSRSRSRNRLAECMGNDHRHVPRLLSHPGTIRMRGHASRVKLTGAVFNEDEDE